MAAVNPLAKKLLLKAGYRAALVNAPAGYADLLEPLPDGAALVDALQPGLDFVQVFVRNAEDVERFVPGALAAIRTDGLLWVCYPKGGKKAGTDLNRDILWAQMGRYDLSGVSLVALDDTWSAMRFRPADKVGR